MDYAEFFARFGGSTRTANIRPPLRRMLISRKARRRRSRRPFRLPRTSELPPEFIRLCPWEAEYLFGVATKARLGIVETGRFNGGSTFLLAAAAPGVPIHSIDVAPQDDDRLRRLFRETGVGATVDLVVGDSQRGDYPQVGPIDLLFVDGDHTYEGCLADLRQWYGRVVPGGAVVLHDAYEGEWGVPDAIRDFLREHPELTVVLPPDSGPRFWDRPHGSLCHLVRGGA